MSTIEPRGTMTDSDWARYTEHLALNARYEHERIEAEKAQRKRYKSLLIDDILNVANDRFTNEELERKSVTVLERIYDYA